MEFFIGIRLRRQSRGSGSRSTPAVLLAALLFAASPAGESRAVVLFNLPNSANQSNPGTGVPWGSVAKVSGSAGGSQTGSAVHIGNGYLLTANHVTIDATSRFVTFDNSSFYEIDASFKAGSRQYGKQVAAGVDMAVIKLTTIPVGVSSAVLLLNGSELIAPATLIGWGFGRDPTAPLGSAVVGWGTTDTAAKRWGLNEPRDAVTIVYDSYSYEALRTVTGGTSNPSGLGDAEAGLATFDSGGGLFQQLGESWYLIGVNAAAESDPTTFGPDRISNVRPRGDYNYFGRVSAYDTQILALVPEPDSGLLAAAAMTILGAVAIHRRCCQAAKKPVARQVRNAACTAHT
jgi:hypothetical protein